MRLRDYLKILTYPITVGTHFNTAFALVLARRWDCGRDAALVALIDAWAEQDFGDRSDYRGWEPGGDALLSPVMTAALLLAEVRPRPAFAPWSTAQIGSAACRARACPHV